MTVFEYVRLIVGIAAALILSGCADVCQNTVLSNTASPDGERHAVLFMRDCGATTDFSTQIAISRSDDEPTGAGNLFIADGGSASAPPTDHGGPWAEVAWQGPRQLLIRYDAMAEVYTQRDRVAGVNVTYEPVRR